MIAIGLVFLIRVPLTYVIFDAELRRKSYSWVTGSNQISMQFGTQADFFGTLGANRVPIVLWHCG